MNWPVKGFLFGFLALLFCLSALSQLSAEDDPAVREYAIKAGFIYNFTKFIEWPEEEHLKTITFCIFGKDPFGEKVLSAFEGKMVRSKVFRIRKLRSLSSIKDCQILYISRSESYRLKRLLRAVNQKGLPILTIGDQEHFIDYGGMINLYRYKNRIRFEINRTPARQRGIKISARLLQLSRPRGKLR